MPVPLGSSVSRTRFGGVLANKFSRQVEPTLRDMSAQQFLQRSDPLIQQLENNRAAQLGVVEEQGGFDFGNFPIIGGVASQTGSAVSGILDVLARPSDAVAGMFLGGQQDNRLGIESPGVGFTRGLLGTSEERADMNFATWLEGAGMDNEWARNTIGLGMSMVLDPLNVLGIGAVRRSIKGAAKGVGAVLAEVPAPLAGRTGKKTLGAVYETVEDVVGPSLASKFSTPVLGTDITHWELDHMARRGKISKDAAERVQKMNRAIRSMQLNGMEQTRRDILAGLDDMGVDEATIRRLINDEEFQAEVGTILVKARQAQKTYDEVAEELEPYGLSGLIQFMRNEFISNAKAVGDDVEALNTAGVFERFGIADLSPQLKETLNAEAFYFRFLFPDTTDVYNRIDTDAALRGVVTGGKGVARSDASKARSVEELLDAGVDTDVLAVIAYDMADTRLKAKLSEFLDDDLLKALKVREIDPNKVNAAMAVLSKHNVNIEVLNSLVRRYRAGDLDIGDAVAEATVRIAAAAPDLKPDQVNRVVNDVFNNVAAPGEATTALNNKVSFLQQVEDATAVSEIRDVAENLRLGAAEQEALQRARTATGQVVEYEGLTSPAIAVDDISAPVTQAIHRQATLLAGPQDVIQMYSTLRNPLAMGGLLKTLDNFNALWKPLVTVFPGNTSYFFRNGFGLMLMAFINGRMPLNAMLREMPNGVRQVMHAGDDVLIPLTPEGIAARQAKGLPVPEDGVLRIKSNDFWRDFEQRGGVAGGYQEKTFIEPGRENQSAVSRYLERVARKAAGQDDPRRTSLDAMKAVWKDYDDNFGRTFPKKGFLGIKFGATVAEGMDNAAKIAGIRWRLSQGDTLDEAAEFARKTFYNYDDVGRAVRQGGSIFPFARWMAVNMPAQVQNLVYNPDRLSKLAIATKSRDSFAEDIEADAYTMPDWILERSHAVLGKDEDGNLEVLYLAGAPFEDINRFFAGGFGNTMENVLADVTPILRAPFEAFALDRSFFTGERISDPSYRNFYTRAHQWTEKVPGLREWLDVRREVTPSGRVHYRSGEPARMFIFASLIGRISSQMDKVGMMVENRADAGTNLLPMLTGIRTTKVLPNLPSDVELGEALRESPAAAALYRNYRNIMVYPQFGDPRTSDKAVKARDDVLSNQRFVMSVAPDMDKQEAREIALRRYSMVDPEGALLVRQIIKNNWKATGRKERSAYSNANPILRGAIEGLTKREQRILQGLALDDD